MGAWRAVLFAFAALASLAACEHDRAPPVADAPSVAKGGTDGQGQGDLMLGGAADMLSGLCGSQTLPAVTNPPNLSFIIDHSGSMGDLLPGSDVSKFENARLALSRVLRAVGHRVNYGATIFPGLAEVTGCEAGDELMKVGPGDPPSYARQGKTGPRLRDLLTRLSIAGLDGGTPAAATLEKMQGTLTALDGKTYVVLITDGAPNCNAELMCEASQCIPNIEGLSYGGVDCTGGVNCCAPTAQLPGANLSCVDADASLSAVTALADAGIQTFVIGMPGSEPYEQLLNAMAEAGGTARRDETKYYSVADLDALEAALKSIAASLAISCDIPLDYDPPDRDFVNVYFDGSLVEYDPEDGWEWTDEGHVAIRGAACDQLSAGDVLEVQVLAGCKTVVK